MQRTKYWHIGSQTWRQDLLEAYRVVHSEVQENSQKVLVRQNERAGAATRATADPWKLTVPRARLDIRKNTFAARVPEKWNRLPVEIKNAPNLIVFKNALKHYHTGTQVDDRTWRDRDQGARGHPREAADDSTMLPAVALETPHQVTSKYYPNKKCIIAHLLFGILYQIM